MPVIPVMDGWTPTLPVALPVLCKKIVTPGGWGDDFSKCNLLNYNRLLCQMVGIDDEGFSW